VIDLAASLAAAVGAEHVEQLTADPLTAPGTAPTWRVSPGTPAEVAEVIRCAYERKVAVHPVGSGARGNQLQADRPRIILTTRRLTEVVQLDETSLLVHAQAGITGSSLEEILGPRGLSIGDYPPAVLATTLGGLLAVRTPGKSSARHGFFEDAVVGVSAVLADGRTVHTRLAPRRATGPDLARALCGSEGTIGFITSAVLRVHQKPEARLVAAYRLPSIDSAVSAVYLALREEAAPSGLRIYDAAEAAIHFPSLARPGGPAALAPGEALLCAATAGPTDLAACDRDLITSAVIAEGGAQTDAALADLWWRRTHAGEVTPGPSPTLQVMATPSKIRTVYFHVREQLHALGVAARAHISRFDADGAILFFTFAREGSPLEGKHDETVRAVAESVAAQVGGWLLGARAVKLDAYLRDLRLALDPHQIMNPGTLA
jgi:alkyldihydroxyacetonephosphate synthase